MDNRFGCVERTLLSAAFDSVFDRAVDSDFDRAFDSDFDLAFAGGLVSSTIDFKVRTEQKHIEKLRYIHRNPEKQRLVDRPEQWEWSSFRSYLYQETGPVRVKFREWPK